MLKREAIKRLLEERGTRNALDESMVSRWLFQFWRAFRWGSSGGEGLIFGVGVCGLRMFCCGDNTHNSQVLRFALMGETCISLFAAPASAVLL